MVPIPARPAKQSVVADTTSSPSDTHTLLLSRYVTRASGLLLTGLRRTRYADFAPAQFLRSFKITSHIMQGVLGAARTACPALSSENIRIYLETNVRVENKKSEVKTERALITPGSWPAMTRPATGAVREINICTREREWGLIEAWRVGWNELIGSVEGSKPRK